MSQVDPFGMRCLAFNFILVNVGINDIRKDYLAASAFADLQTIYNLVQTGPDNRLIACTVKPFKGDSKLHGRARGRTRFGQRAK